MKPFFVPFPTRALPTFIEEKMVYWNLFHEKFIHYLKNLFSCFVNSQIIAEKKMFTIFILSSVLNECHQVMLLPQSNVSSNCRQKFSLSDTSCSLMHVSRNFMNSSSDFIIWWWSLIQSSSVTASLHMIQIISITADLTKCLSNGMTHSGFSRKQQMTPK